MDNKNATEGNLNIYIIKNKKMLKKKKRKLIFSSTSYSKYRKNSNWTFKITGGCLGHRMQEGILVYMLLTMGHHWLYNLKYGLLLTLAGERQHLRKEKSTFQL